MNDADIFEPAGEGPSYHLTIPVTEKGFASFLRDLIGGKGRLTFNSETPMALDVATLRGLVDAITSRVSSQNTSELLISEYNIRFANGRSYRLTNLEDALALSPIGDNPTKYVSIKLVFLLKYPNQASFSREEVVISFTSDPLTRSARLGSVSDEEFGLFAPVRVIVQFSERSWAEDLISLIQRVLDTAPLPPGYTSTRRLSKLSGINTTFNNLVGNFLITFAYCTVAYYLIGVPPDATVDHADATSASLMYEMQSALANISTVRIVATVVGFLGLLLAILVGFTSLLNKLAEKLTTERFVFLLYPPDERLQDDLTKRLSQQRWKAVGGFLLSIVASIVAAIIYQYWFVLGQ